MLTPSLLGLLFSWTGVLVVLLSIVHVVVCVFLLLVVLLQRGKSGDVMSAFGGPTPSSYAAMSTDDLLSRLTKAGAGTFMITSLALALLASRTERSVLADEPDEGAPAEASAPAETPAEMPAETPAETPAESAAPAEGAMPAPAGEAAPAPAEGAAPTPAPDEGGAPAPAEGTPSTP